MTIGEYGTITEDMVLRRGQDFVHEFSVSKGAFANGTTATFEIYTRDRTTLLGLWPAADIASTKITVQILAELADDIPNGAFYTLYVQEPGRPRLAWYEGPVWRKGRA